ncbi:MAG: hypothetical protein QOE23_244, partial [Pseudonocardiales bacterium]|nr:hypothetical protein [Pseudonocardiales bacterium]
MATPTPTSGTAASSLGLREQHKRRTRRAITAAAMALFFERGFDTKEDLFFDEVHPLRDALVEAVRRCPSGTSLMLALREQVLFQLTAGRTAAEADEVTRFHAAVVDSPDLQRREQHLQLLRRQALTDALAGALDADAPFLTPELAAAQYLAAEAVIGAELRTRLLGGQPLPDALADLQPVTAGVF